MIHITRNISLDENEIEEKFIRSSGPGGQNVNRVETAVQLRFDAAGSPSLPDEVKKRLKRVAGKRLSREGVLVIDARRYRTQEQNRRDALERLRKLIARAAEKPKARKPTKPTRASRERRMEAKEKRSRTKRLRRPVSGSDD